MEINLETLLRGKATLIKGKEYLSAEAYVTPFLERMSKYTDDFRIQAKLPDQISITRNKDINFDDIVYNRVWIQAVLPDGVDFENHVKVVGLVYGLDTRKPVSKIYTGGLNCACTNLCVFNPDDIEVSELEPATPINFKRVVPMAEEVLNVAEWLKKLSHMELPYNDRTINEELGRWVRNTFSCSYGLNLGKVKLATSSAIDAYKLLYEKEDSPYYVPVNETTTMFNVYNAWTQTITDDARDIMNKAEKCLLLKQILRLF